MPPGSSSRADGGLPFASSRSEIRCILNATFFGRSGLSLKRGLREKNLQLRELAANSIEASFLSPERKLALLSEVERYGW